MAAALAQNVQQQHAEQQQQLERHGTSRQTGSNNHLQRTQSPPPLLNHDHAKPKTRTTEVPSSMVEELLADMAPQFGPTDYSLLTRNCNHFSNEFAQLLTGDSIPVGLGQLGAWGVFTCKLVQIKLQWQSGETK